MHASSTAAGFSVRRQIRGYPESMSVPSVDPVDVKAEMEGANPPILLDVREPEELAVSAIPGALNIPLGDLPNRASELDADAQIVVLCRSGVRSSQATSYLLARGFKNVRNIAGGINAWARTVDPSLQLY